MPEVHEASSASPLPRPARIEALVDGIFAVAMTLLVLDIKLPDELHFETDAELLRHFTTVEFTFANYVISFFVLGIFWTLHHFQFRFVLKLDRGLLWINLFFLFFTTLVPFTTSLAASHEQLQVPLTLYAINLLLLFLTLALHLNRLRRVPGLASDELTPAIASVMARRLLLVCVLPVLAIAVGMFAPRWGLRVFYLLALLHFLTPLIDRRARRRASSG